MIRVLVAGLINIETTLKIDGFPVAYNPVRFAFNGVRSTVSGVGYNIAKALTTLGDEVRFLGMIGRDDMPSLLVRQMLHTDHIPADHVLSLLDATPQSVILYDSTGRRAINVDLKDIQETVYPAEHYEQAVRDCELAVLCNINFARPFLAQAKAAGIPIATDVHAISNLDDDYNGDYMAHANILFMSDERLPCAPEEFARQILNRYGTEIVVIGLGGEGALLSVKDDHFMERIPALHLREVVNTIGAGDALFSAFIHTYTQTHDPYRAIQHATIFASYKIGVSGAADGFMTADKLNAFYTEWYKEA